MRVLWLLPVFAALPLALGGWALASEGVTPTCTASDKKLTYLPTRDGYTLACGPGSAVVRVKGATYRIKGSRCFRGPTGARLYFGVFNWRNPPQPVPQNGLYLVIDRRPAQPAVADLGDGGIDLVTSANIVLSGTPSGTAHLVAGLKRGTFAGVGRSGNLDGVRFSGSWNCG